jgi:hypothetical protein
LRDRAGRLVGAVNMLLDGPPAPAAQPEVRSKSRRQGRWPQQSAWRRHPDAHRDHARV